MTDTTAPATPPTPPTTAPVTASTLSNVWGAITTILGWFSSGWTWLGSMLPTKQSWTIFILALIVAYYGIRFLDGHDLKSLVPSGISIQSPIKIGSPPAPKAPVALLAAPVAPVIVAPPPPAPVSPALTDLEQRLGTLEALVAEIQARLGVVRRRAPVAK